MISKSNKLFIISFNFPGQTPIMLAEDDDKMVQLLKNHLCDVQNTGPTKRPWKFRGAWEIYGNCTVVHIVHHIEFN